jgi:hypothetical protein
MTVTVSPAASALTDALAALQMARQAVEAALGHIGAEGYEAPTRLGAARRTTGTQILEILSTYRDPMTLIDIADAICAMRRGEDEPRARGGTRYQEIARSSLARLIERGLVRRVEPKNNRELMRFERVL